jgi:hypothetical protein
MVSGDLTPVEAVEAGEAFADVHCWAAPAWRRVATGTASRASILADVDDMTTRLEQLRAVLLKSGTTDGPEGELTVDNSELARKGALAKQRIDFDPEVAAACDDLAWLAERGALAGVSEIIRERRRQIEHGFTPQYDSDTAADGGLVHQVRHWAGEVIGSRRAGVADIGSDEDGLRQAGALAAAEIDRLNRQASAQETAEILADPEMMDAIREGESDLR